MWFDFDEAIDRREVAKFHLGIHVVGYNVQAAAEIDHHLIVVHDVVQTGHDRAVAPPKIRR